MELLVLLINFLFDLTLTKVKSIFHSDHNTMTDHNQHQIINHNKTKALGLGVLTLVLLLALLFGNNKNGGKSGFPLFPVDSIGASTE